MVDNLTQEDKPFWIVESAVRRWESESADKCDLRSEICSALQDLAGIDRNSALSLAETIVDVAESEPRCDTRLLAAAVLRISGCDGLLATKGPKRPDRQIVHIIEQGYGALLERTGVSRQSQTHEKISVAHTIHQNACDKLSFLNRPFSTLRDLNGAREILQRELNQGPLKAYLNPFGYPDVHTTISSILSQVADVIKSEGTARQATLASLSEALSDEIEQVGGIPTFLVQDHLLPFLTATKAATIKLEASLSDEFACSISTPDRTHRFEKRYPLHLVDSEIQVFVPLRNSGPGTAQDVQVKCISENCKVVSKDTRLGEVTRGPFVLTLVFEVTHPTDVVDLEVEVFWGVVGEAHRQSAKFSVQAEAQRTDLDWEALAARQPYSLDIASGQDFYGRRDALRRIMRRLSSSWTPARTSP